MGNGTAVTLDVLLNALDKLTESHGAGIILLSEIGVGDDTCMYCEAIPDIDTGFITHNEGCPVEIGRAASPLLREAAALLNTFYNDDPWEGYDPVWKCNVCRHCDAQVVSGSVVHEPDCLRRMVLEWLRKLRIQR